LKKRWKNVAIHQRFYERKDSKSRKEGAADERRIENSVVQEAVLSVTLFPVAMAGITDGLEEPIKIIGYVDRRLGGTRHTPTPTSRYNPNTNNKDTDFKDGENQSYHVQPKKISNNHNYQNEHMGERRENRLDNIASWDLHLTPG
jgi:hypothetical protein